MFPGFIMKPYVFVRSQDAGDIKIEREVGHKMRGVHKGNRRTETRPGKRKSLAPRPCTGHWIASRQEGAYRHNLRS